MFNIIWQSPLVLFGLAAVAAPILIHILVQRHAERLAFPTLRFLQPTRLAAIRRHLLDDGALLAVRVAILAAAVAALAGPLIITAARRQTWERRMVRAVVVDSDVAPSFPASARLPEERATARHAEAPEARRRQGGESAAPYRSLEFTAGSLPDGIRRAVAWLATAPPARREIVVVSPFAVGSLTAADVAAVPASIGIRFERKGTLPATRTIQAGRVLEAGGVVAREATLDGGRTSVRDAAAAEPVPSPIEIVNAPADQPAIDAAVAAVLSLRVWAPAPDRRARLVVHGEEGYGPFSTGSAEKGQSPFSPTAIRTPWMADAVVRLVRDTDLQTAAAQVATGLADARFHAAPWQAVAFSADGRPLAVAAESSGRLVVVSAAGASTIATPLLIRSLGNALGTVPDWQAAEVAPIADRLLREWARPPAAPPVPTADDRRQGEGENDRRWPWLMVLCLLGIETWMRRARGVAAAAGGEIARVA